MRPPLAGKREAARRLAERARGRLGPLERVLPAKQPGPDGARERVVVAPEDAAARIDAARARLRATIEPPAEDRD
jgi:hypothetical protein